MTETDHGALPAPALKGAEAAPEDPSFRLFPEPPPSLVRSEREILIEVTAVAKGVRVKGAKIYARGVDPMRPWYEYLQRQDRREDDVAATPYGTTCFRVMEGTRIGLVAYHGRLGCVERVIYACPDGGPDAHPDGVGLSQRVVLEMPPERPLSPLRVELTSKRPGRDFVPVTVRLCSPVLGVPLDHFPLTGLGMTTSRSVAPGDYALQASLSRRMGCGVGMAFPDEEAWEGARVTARAGEVTHVTGSFERGATMYFRTSEGGAATTGPNGVTQEPGDLLVATILRGGERCAYVSPERTLTHLTVNPPRDEAFFPGGYVATQRALLPGDYTVTIEGPRFEPVSIDVTVPVPSEVHSDPFGGYWPETVDVTVQLQRRLDP